MRRGSPNDPGFIAFPPELAAMFQEDMFSKPYNPKKAKKFSSLMTQAFADHDKKWLAKPKSKPASATASGSASKPHVNTMLPPPARIVKPKPRRIVSDDDDAPPIHIPGPNDPPSSSRSTATFRRNRSRSPEPRTNHKSRSRSPRGPVLCSSSDSGSGSGSSASASASASSSSSLSDQAKQRIAQNKKAALDRLAKTNKAKPYFVVGEKMAGARSLSAKVERMELLGTFAFEQACAIQKRLLASKEWKVKSEPYINGGTPHHILLHDTVSEKTYERARKVAETSLPSVLRGDVEFHSPAAVPMPNGDIEVRLGVRSIKLSDVSAHISRICGMGYGRHLSMTIATLEKT